MIPEYPQFKPIDLGCLTDIEDHLKGHPPNICEFSSANLIIWQDFDRYQLTLINNNLCILNDPLTEPCFFFAPIGHNEIKATIATCLKHCGSISRVTEDFIKNLPQDQYHFKCLRSQFDYVYERQVLAELKGRKFDGKRNHIKRFIRRFPEYKFVPLEPQHKKAALELFEQWFTIREESRHFPRLAHNSQKIAIEQAFKHFKELELHGGAIFAEDKLQGFILGSQLNKDTATLHFLYGNPKAQGISQILLKEGCEKVFSQYKYINQEQDLGIPGLRKAKLSYHPHHLEKKFEIKAK
ncbi:hypothetical protein A2291_06225 [candidate division WOR-1 bacterium RIFOXYB2_FULL_42_35]|uniref:Phosphatidylglycerol lysyltransferase C-terminal domain-containing protein n=1 Tax=candidate division WOR-1 bacterium RIFOXYC2_FULL_41_25 TaxID=1802586 RepID=A0A1F4TIQ6_UNCSA|nr:MAG: hypothetical protein A2247_07845 [candidate division WOR-1 bacterium RIFOXYA2_FULL_41_14]OGC21618.1 MAG: hypothetical protein A2291_06225 [candidate division WOR-1 bacterium RIFOXYB2_FULL_42_35]OGC32621.1 MAG: hypothetical protein A2462_01985 [candidate division WOR-1 bacterium RIFOXYC2_FULL_41_25]